MADVALVEVVMNTVAAVASRLVASVVEEVIAKVMTGVMAGVVVLVTNVDESNNLKNKLKQMNQEKFSYKGGKEKLATKFDVLLSSLNIVKVSRKETVMRD